MLVECLYRVSTKSQVDHADIPLQRIECRKYAEARGWKIIKELYEEGVSGYKTSADERDAILQLREDALCKSFDVLLVFMFDRLGRREEETPFVVEWFIRQGIRVFSVHEGEQKLDNHTDKLLNYLYYWQGESESLHTSARVKTRMDQMRSEGLFVGGHILYGYRPVDHGRKNKRNNCVFDLEIDPAEAAVVKEIFRRTLEGVGSAVLARELNEKGIRTRKGKEFQRQTIKRILQNRQYTGYRISQNAVSPFLPELQIISEKDFERAAEIAARRKENHINWQMAPRRGVEPLLVNGVLYCGTCGHRMVWSRPAEGAKRTTAQYVCGASIDQKDVCLGQRSYSANKVDSKVVRVTNAILALMQEALPESTLKRAQNQQRQQYKNELEKAKKEAEKAAAGERYWTDEITKSLLSESEYTPQIINGEYKKAARKEEKALQKQEEQQQLLDELKQKHKHIRDLYKQFPVWREVFVSGSVEEKQKVFAELYACIEIERGYKMTLHLDAEFEELLCTSENKNLRRLWAKINKMTIAY